MENIQIKKKGNLYCLNDWVENIVHSKDPRSYYRKLKYPKQKLNGKWYVDENSMNEIYSRSTLMHGNGINGPYGKYGKLYKHKQNTNEHNVKNEKDTQVTDNKLTKINSVICVTDDVASKGTKDEKYDIDAIDDIDSEYSIDEDYELDDVNVDSKDNNISIIKSSTSSPGNNRLIDIENNLLKFDGKDVKVITDKNGEIWFKGVNIASVLEYKNTRKSLIDHVDEDDKNQLCHVSKFSGNYNKNSELFLQTRSNTDPLLPTEIKGIEVFDARLPDRVIQKLSYNESKTIYINESGLYSLIMKSKMKKAKEFQRWITKEVLPSIRKTGQYNIHDSIKTNTVPQLAYDINDYLNKNAIYLLHMENDVYKFGVTRNMKERDSELKRMKYKSIHKIYTVKNNDIGCDVENMIKAYVKQTEIHRHFNIYTR